ncbi:MAG: tRNA (adenosine(37)-N6)-threonylcarbamoyltransferase complex dimerization subunit type 1 TsaB [Sphingomonadales bacterium]
MRAMAIDTAMTRCAVAVADGPRIVAHIAEDMARGHAEALLPMVAMACEAAGLDLNAIERLAVTTGPGSFTGVRVGVAAARGIALATGCGLVPMTCLEAVAAGYYAGGGGLACTVLQDARRGEVYAQRFAPPGSAGQRPRALNQASVMTIADAARLLAGEDGAILGTGIDQCGSGLDPARQPAHDPLPDCRVLALLAQTGQAVSGDAVHPFYLRAPDAKPPRPTPLAPAASAGG